MAQLFRLQFELLPKQQDSKDNDNEADDTVSIMIKRNPIHGIYVDCCLTKCYIDCIGQFGCDNIYFVMIIHHVLVQIMSEIQEAKCMHYICNCIYCHMQAVSVSNSKNNL